MALIDDPGWGGGFIADWLLCVPFYYGYSDRPANGTLPHDDDYLRHPKGEGYVRPVAFNDGRRRGQHLGAARRKAR